VNVSVGTIFSVLARPPDLPAGNVDAAVLQPGSRQIAAGYVVYSSSTILVYTTGQGVHGFTFDPAVGAYVLSHENIRMPAAGNIYSMNDAQAETFAEPYRKYLARLRSGATGRKYSCTC
jgi:fructose-1,6-bisphosphatase I